MDENQQKTRPLTQPVDVKNNNNDQRESGRSGPISRGRRRSRSPFRNKKPNNNNNNNNNNNSIDKSNEPDNNSNNNEAKMGHQDDTERDRRECAGRGVIGGADHEDIAHRESEREGRDEREREGSEHKLDTLYVRDRPIPVFKVSFAFSLSLLFLSLSL